MNQRQPKRFAFWRAKNKKQDTHAEHEMHCTALCCAKHGERANVVQLVGDAAEAARLRDLGICEGATVQVLRDGDPLIVRVADARFGIGRAAAMNVLCEIHKGDAECRKP